MNPLYTHLLALVAVLIIAMLVTGLLWWESYCSGRNERIVQKASQSPEFWVHPCSDKRRTLRDQVLAAGPLETELRPTTQCVPEDFISHHHDWRLALLMAIENAETSGSDPGDESYWRHQLKVFDHAYAEIGVDHAD